MITAKKARALANEKSKGNLFRDEILSRIEFAAKFGKYELYLKRTHEGNSVTDKDVQFLKDLGYKCDRMLTNDSYWIRW